MRYEMEGRNLFVMPDSPVLRHYRVDYPNVAREAQCSQCQHQHQRCGASRGNSSSSSLANTSNNKFWRR